MPGTLEHIASCLVIGTSDPPTMLANDGGFVQGVTDNGPGDYTVNLKDPVDANEIIIQATVLGSEAAIGAGALVNVALPTAPADTALRIRCYENGGTFAETAISLAVSRRVSGQRS